MSGDLQFEVHPGCQCVAEPTVKATAKQDLQEAVRRIEQTHRLPDNAGKVDITTPAECDVATADGVYKAIPGGGNAELQIAERVKGVRLQETVTHEMGHHLDRLLGLKHQVRDGISAIRVRVPRELRDAIQGSDAVAALRDSWRGKMMGKYFLRDDELFARAYSQYIATKTDNKALLEIFHASPEHWAAKDFEPISAAFDKLLADEGLLK